MKKLLLTILLFAVAAEAQVSVPIAANKWQLWNRAVNRLPVYSVPSGGIGFDFEVSQQPDPNAGPTWDGYFVSAVNNISLTGSEIVVTFAIHADPSAVWNYASDSWNTNPPPANFHVYVQTSDGHCKDLFSICNPPQLRWWSNPVKFTLVDTGGTVELHVPITPENWSETDGVPATDPTFYPYWVQTMNSPHWVGITFGGGCCFGHGVSVSSGNAQFTLLGWETR